MRDSTREFLSTLWGLLIATTGCVLTEARGAALLAPLILFIYFLKAYLNWVDDDGDEISDFHEEVKKMFKEIPPIDTEKKEPISEEEMAAFYRRKRRRRRLRR